MDYFNGITNDNFKAYFLKDLNCLDELVQYIYPNEMLEGNSVVDAHIIRCQEILSDYILDILAGNDNISTEKINELFNEKRKELILILSDDIEIYFENVKLKIIDLR